MLAGAVARDPRAPARRRDPGRRPDRQRPGQRARARAGGAARRRRAAGQRARAGTSASSSPATPTRSTTGPTSTPRATRGCSAAAVRRSRARACARAVVPGARRPRHPRRGRARADAADASARARRPGRVGAALGLDAAAGGRLRGADVLARRAAGARRSSTSSWPQALAAPKVRVPRRSDAPRAGRRGGGRAAARAAPARRSGPARSTTHVDIGDRAAPDRARPRPPRRAARAAWSARPAGVAGRRSSRGAGERWVIVVSHQPLESSDGGEQLLALLDRTRA